MLLLVLTKGVLQEIGQAHGSVGVDLELPPLEVVLDVEHLDSFREVEE